MRIQLNYHLFHVFNLLLSAYEIYLRLMRKILLATIFVFSIVSVNAQTPAPAPGGNAAMGSSNDHLMVQLSYDRWLGVPDSIRLKNLQRSLNVYFMLDKPFKKSKHLSLGIGAGFGSSNLYLDRQVATITDRTRNTVIFEDRQDTLNFKKFKITGLFLEAPIEIRWVKDRSNTDKSFKAAIGIKVGTVLSGYTKARQPQFGEREISKTVEKVKDRLFFTNPRVSATARVGIGHFNLFAQYQITGTFKENLGPNIRPLSIGICLTGL
jgi:hypothetical protein